MLAVGNDRLFELLRERLGLPEEARFATNSLRVANRDALAALIQERLEQQPTATWLERLAGIPAAPVQTVREAATHEQTQALGILQELAGRTRLAEPLTVDGERVVHASPPPSLGKHSRDVLQEAGYSDDELDELEAAGVVR